MTDAVESRLVKAGRDDDEDADAPDEPAASLPALDEAESDVDELPLVARVPFVDPVVPLSLPPFSFRSACPSNASTPGKGYIPNDFLNNFTARA